MSLSFHSLLIKDDNFDKTDYDIRIFDVTTIKLGYGLTAILAEGAIEEFVPTFCTLLEHLKN